MTHMRKTRFAAGLLAALLALGPVSVLAEEACPTCPNDPLVTSESVNTAPAPAEAEGAWYSEALTYARNRGLLDGVPNQFVANEPVTRDVVAAVLYAMGGKNAQAEAQPFADVGQAAWFYSAVAWCRQTGIVKGRGDNLFQPNYSITRAELSVMIERFLPTIGQVAMPGNLVVFSDYDTVPAYARSGMATCVGYKFIQGKSGARLDPGGLCTWAQLVTILQRIGALTGDQATQPDETAKPDQTAQSDDTQTTTSTKTEPQRPQVVEEARAKLTNVRADYPTDAAFANFREVTAGDIAPGVLYRSASPINPGPCRNGVADSLLGSNGINTVVNLADCRFRYQGYPGYTGTQYSARKIVSLNMAWDYLSDAFSEDMHNGLEFLTEEEGPYLLHGDLGIERTGFVCMVLEALMGASWEEIRDDYMLSYENCCFVEKDSQQWQDIAEATVAAQMLSLLGETDPDRLATADLAQAARTYLTATVGLTAEQVALLKEHLSTPVK